MGAEPNMNELPSEEKDLVASTLRGRRDIALAILMGVANLVVLSLCWRTIGVQSDESINICGALRILEGENIYRDFWVYHTPGIFFLTAAIFATLGKSLLAVRMVLILAASATASGLYLLGRKFMAPFPAALAAALFIMIGVNLWPIGGYHWHSTFLLVFSALVTARFLEDRSRRKSLFAGGFLAGTTFLFQQPKGGYLLCLMFLFLAADELMQKEEMPRLRRLIRTGAVFAAGATISILIVAVYLALVGTLGEAVSATVLYPIKLLFQTSAEKGYAGFYGSMTGSTLSQLAAMFPLLGNGRWAAATATCVINFAAPLSIVIAVGVWLIRRRQGKERNAIALLCSVAALAAYGSALQKPDFFHLLTISPACYLTIAYIVHSISPAAEGGKLFGARRAAGFALAAVLVLSYARIVAGDLVYASRLETVSLGSPLGFISVPEEKADAAAFGDPLINVIDYIQLNTGKDEGVFAMSYSPFIYYLGGRRNPTPYLDIPSSPCMGGARFHVFKLGHASFNLERLKEIALALDADRTPIVILDPAAACQVRSGWDEAGLEDEPLIDYIKTHYSIEADLGVYVIMTRSDRHVRDAGGAPRRGQPPQQRSR